MSDYQGWKNHETWCVALWIDNEEWSAKHFYECAADLYANPRTTNGDVLNPKERAVRELSDKIKEWAMESLDDYQERVSGQAKFDGMITHLLGAAMESVDFWEIAERYIEVAESESTNIPEGTPMLDGGDRSEASRMDMGR